MPVRLFVLENAGSRVYRIGRVGYDTGAQDAGGVFTGTLRTEKISPAGEDGLAYFRRIAVRCWRTGAFTLTLKAFVDGVQTVTYDAAGVASLQNVTFTEAAPTTSPEEKVIEAEVLGTGTYVEVELTIPSNTSTGVLLVESIEVHYLPLRQAKSRGGAETS